MEIWPREMQLPKRDEGLREFGQDELCILARFGKNSYMLINSQVQKLSVVAANRRKENLTQRIVP